MKLNLGCGKDIRKGYVNVDSFRDEGIDRVIDLNKLPYPFKTNSCDEIVMQDILEHLDNPEKVLEEIYRIAKDRAIIKIRVPHFSSANTWGDLTHRRGFSYICFHHYTEEGRESSSFEIKRKMKFKMRKMQITFSNPYRSLGFGHFWSRFPKIYERMFYGIFPAEGIYFELEAIKR